MYNILNNKRNNLGKKIFVINYYYKYFINLSLPLISFII